MGKKKDQIKNYRLNPSSKRDVRKFLALKEDGWEVISETQRTSWQTWPGQIDYTLRKRAPQV